MRENIGKMFKQLREHNNLTLERLSRLVKYPVSELTKLESEGGDDPDIKLVERLRDFYNLSCDSLFMPQTPLLEPDLIVVTNLRMDSEVKELCAVFDTTSSTFLTPHLFDNILLGDDYHIGVRFAEDKKVPENKRTLDDLGEINYSCVIDNDGNIYEFPKWTFGYSRTEIIFGNEGTFVDNVAPALNNKDGRVYLVDNLGKKISDGFSRFECLSGGIYIVSNMVTGSEGQKIVMRSDVLYKDGKIINGLTLRRSDEAGLPAYAEELNDITTVISFVKKYGPGILELTQNEVFEPSSNYILILRALEEYEKKNGYVYRKKGRRVKEGFEILLQKSRYCYGDTGSVPFDLVLDTSYYTGELFELGLKIRKFIEALERR